MAYLDAYHLTQEKRLLDAARRTADCLIRGQLHSGGWADSIDFEPDDRRRSAYRVDGLTSSKARNVSTLDDDKTQSVVRFLARLDQTLSFEDRVLHEATRFALDSLVQAQFPIGAWPQGFTGPADPQTPVLSASYPETWSREFPKADYKGFYTLNDNTHVDTIRLMLLAHQIYRDERLS